MIERTEVDNMDISSEQKVIHFPSIHLTYDEAKIIKEQFDHLFCYNDKLQAKYHTLFELFNMLRRHLKGLS